MRVRNHHAFAQHQAPSKCGSRGLMSGHLGKFSKGTTQWVDMSGQKFLLSRVWVASFTCCYLRSSRSLPCSRCLYIGRSHSMLVQAGETGKDLAWRKAVGAGADAWRIWRATLIGAGLAESFTLTFRNTAYRARQFYANKALGHFSVDEYPKFQYCLLLLRRNHAENFSHRQIEKRTSDHNKHLHGLPQPVTLLWTANPVCTAVGMDSSQSRVYNQVELISSPQALFCPIGNEARTNRFPNRTSNRRAEWAV